MIIKLVKTSNYRGSNPLVSNPMGRFPERISSKLPNRKYEDDKSKTDEIPQESQTYAIGVDRDLKNIIDYTNRIPKVDDTKGAGDTTYTWSADKITDKLGTWTDYSATSTVVGWSSYLASTPQIYYKKVGTLVFVSYYINGTSNSTLATFTLPDVSASVMIVTLLITAMNNGGQIATALMQMNNASSTVQCFTTLAGAGWVASGQKIIAGQFFYETS